MLNFVYLETIFNFQSSDTLQTPFYLIQTIQIKENPQTSQAFIGVLQKAVQDLSSVFKILQHKMSFVPTCL